MKKLSTYGIHTILSLTLMSLQPSSFATDLDTCAKIDSLNQKVTLALKSSYLDHGAFYGVFEIENNGKASVIEITGVRKGDVFRVMRPELTVQFKDLTGNWIPLLVPPGTFSIRPDRLALLDRKKGMFTSQLMSKEIAEQSASDFRILLRPLSPPMCIVSQSFRAMPVRGPVVGFETRK